MCEREGGAGQMSPPVSQQSHTSPAPVTPPLLTGGQAAGRPRIALPVIVEGRYDKSTLTALFDVSVLVTGGFSLFKAKERQALLRRVAGERGVIVLTDPDGGGQQIRSFLSGILPRDKVFHVYIPRIPGKERRKAHASRAGVLGVEGVGREVLERAFAPFILPPCENGGEATPPRVGCELSYADFYADGFAGGERATERRDRLAAALHLPTGMSAKALLQAICLTVSYPEYRRAADSVMQTGGEGTDGGGRSAP